jgi:acetoin utilization protein AcuC
VGEQGAVLAWDPRLVEYDFGPDHPFQMRYRGEAARRLAESNAGWAIPGPIEPAERPVLTRFHREAYLTFVETAGRTGRRPPLDHGDTPSFPGCFEAAARIVEATRIAATSILEGRTRRAFSPTGGLHHAHPDRASGFCIFNDVAVAIASSLRPVGPLSRVAYVDIDAHHGDGVMYGFYGDGRVLDIDVHQDGRTIFPGTGAVNETGRGDGAGAKVNLSIPPGAGDGTLVPLIRRVAVPLLREFRPELLILQHGVDGHADDGLAALEYSDDGYAAVLEELIEVSDGVGARGLLVTGGGGYHRSNVTRVLEAAGRRLVGGTPVRVDEVAEEFGVEPLAKDLGRALGRSFGVP